MSGIVRVIGVGSPHGDDAVGLEAVRHLQMSDENSDGVEFHAVDSGQRLLDLIDGLGDLGGLILIDGLKRQSLSVGTIHRMTWPDPRIDGLHPGSTHALGAAQALQLAAALSRLPKQVIVYAIEIANAEPGDGLSSKVAASLPELVNRVRTEIESMRNSEDVR
jgi:hydrogenase maturation protease